MNTYARLKAYCLRHGLEWRFDTIYSPLHLIWEIIKLLNTVVTDMDDLKKAMDDLMITVEGQVNSKVIETMESWLNDGTLESLINDLVLSEKLDVVVFENFVTDITSTVSRLDDRVYDIRKYEIEPFTDITQKLQTLVNLVSINGGGTIYLPNGKYMISPGSEDGSSGVVLKDNVKLLGQSKNGVVIYPSNHLYNNGMIYAVSRNNVSIENLTIDGRIIQTDFKSKMIRLKGCLNPVVKEVDFQNIDGTGLIISECVNSLVSEIVFKNIDGNNLTGNGVGGQCIYAEDLKGGVIEKIHAENIGDHVIYFDCTEGGKGEKFIIKDLFAKNTGTNGATQGAAINITNTQENFIIDSVVLEDVKTGIRLGNNGDRNLQPKFFTLSNIQIKSTKTGAGIYIHNGGVTRTRTYGNLENITIINTGYEGVTTSPYGLRMEGVSNMNLSNIMVNGTQLNGVRLSGVANVIVNNLIVAYVSASSPEGEKYGLYIQNPNGTSNGRITIKGFVSEQNTGVKNIFNATGTPLWISDYHFNLSTVDNSGTITVPTVTTTP